MKKVANVGPNLITDSCVRVDGISTFRVGLWYSAVVRLLKTVRGALVHKMLAWGWCNETEL